jgi:hypothetical protein
MDEFLVMQKIEFSRNISRQGKSYIDKIVCKIRGLGQKPSMSNAHKRALV